MRPSNSQVALPNKLLSVEDFHQRMLKYGYKSPELKEYYNKFELKQQLYIINYFSYGKFCGYINGNYCHEFMIFISDKIIEICNADNSKMYLLNILITRIIPLLNNEDQDKLIMQNNFLDSFEPEYILRLFNSISAKINKSSYDYILSYKKFITGDDGKTYLKYSGNTLYLQKRCDSNSYPGTYEDLLDFVISFFATFDAAEWDLVIQLANQKSGFCKNSNFNILLGRQPTFKVIQEFIDAVADNKLDLDGIERFINSNECTVVAFNNYELLKVAFMTKQWSTVKNTLNRIFFPPFVAHLNAHLPTYTTLMRRIKCVLLEYSYGATMEQKYDFRQYNELFPLILKKYMYGDSFDMMISAVIPDYTSKLAKTKKSVEDSIQLLRPDIKEYTTQLKILHLLLHKRFYQYIESDLLDKLPCPEIYDDEVVRKLFKVCFIQGIEEYLKALNSWLQPTQLQLAQVIINLCMYKQKQEIDDINKPRLDVLYSSMMVLYKMINYKLLLEEYPQIADELIKNLSTSFQHNNVNFLVSLFYHSFNYKKVDGRIVDKNIEDLLRIIVKPKSEYDYYMGKNIDVDTKAKVAACVFKLYWQQKKYNICDMVLEQLWASDNTKTLNSIFYALSNLHTIEQSEYVMKLVMKYQKCVDIGYMERILQKHIYYLSLVGGDSYGAVRCDYMRLLSCIRKRYINFNKYAHCIFQYYTVLNLSMEFFMITLANFPEDKFKIWCDRFDQNSSDTYVLRAAIENPKIIYFLHSFMQKGIGQSDKIVRIDACCLALKENDVSKNDKYSHNEISMGKYINAHWASLTSYLCKEFGFNFKEHPDLINWCTLILGVQESYKNKVVVVMSANDAAPSSPPL